MRIQGKTGLSLHWPTWSASPTPFIASSTGADLNYSHVQPHLRFV